MRKNPTVMMAARYDRDPRMLAGAHQALSGHRESHDSIHYIGRRAISRPGEAPDPPVTAPPQ
jgi:hypothetical protein